MNKKPETGQTTNTFEDCFEVWEGTCYDTLEEAEAWVVLKAKAVTLKHSFLIWQNVYLTNPKEEEEVWATVKAKAATFEEYQWLWKETPTGSPQEEEVWALLKVTADTLEECFLLWQYAHEDTPEKDDASVLVKARVKTARQRQWLRKQGFQAT